MKALLFSVVVLLTHFFVGQSFFYIHAFPSPDKSSSVPPSRDGNAVDLGLSVMWSDRNLGAVSETDFGDYYGYGDVTGMVTSTSNANYVSEDVLGTDRDPAYLSWSAGWRKPSASEIQELVDQCIWTWSMRNGVMGYTVTGRENNSIFLPAAGFRTGTKRDFIGRRGYYWSGEVNPLNSNYVTVLFFYSGGKYVKDYRKIYGFAIRPVKESF